MKLKVEVFGTGCAKCKRLEKNVNEALAQAGITAEVIKVEDINAIVARGIMVTPALAINGEVKLMGKVPSVDELLGIIRST